MQVTRFGKMILEWQSRVMTLVLTGVLAVALTTGSPGGAQQLPDQTTAPGLQTQEQLQQLVAPIALYPDPLIAQILAAATYPTEIVQADRWLQQHSNLQGEQLASAADKQSWDPSVKALTAFPSVLANLDKNLSWTEALGNAYFNQQQDVLDAVQIMRRRAENAGNLRSTPQQTVTSQGATIVIQPVEPDVCYLPSYDPWLVYGAPIAVYPGYFYEPWYGPPFISFGPAIGLSFFGGFGWGWPAWGFNWGRRVVVFNHSTYVSRSRFFFNRGAFSGGRGGLPIRGVPFARTNHSFNNRGGIPNARFGNGWANRGPGSPRTTPGFRSGSSFGTRPGGIGRQQNSRGGYTGSRPSFGGGRSVGGARGFGGSSRGGGYRGGGGRRHR